MPPFPWYPELIGFVSSGCLSLTIYINMISAVLEKQQQNNTYNNVK